VRLTRPLFSTGILFPLDLENQFGLYLPYCVHTRLNTLTFWSFDVHFLIIARSKVYCIVDVLVAQHDGDKCKLRPVLNTVSMVEEMLQIRGNSGREFMDCERRVTTAPAHARNKRSQDSL